jgi:hypothetical protein
VHLIWGVDNGPTVVMTSVVLRKTSFQLSEDTILFVRIISTQNMEVRENNPSELTPILSARTMISALSVIN